MTEMQSSNNKIDNQCTGEVLSEDLEGVDGALCNVEADEYFLNIKGELNQVDRLVSDAVNNLVINFRYISKLTKTHHEMVTTIERMAIPDGNKPILELLDKQMEIADEGISKAVNIAKTKGKRKPVVQQGMQMGDVELF